MIAALDEIPRAADPCEPGSAVLVVGVPSGRPFTVSEWEERQLALSRGSGPPR
jgi:hypothetical protein